MAELKTKELNTIPLKDNTLGTDKVLITNEAADNLLEIDELSRFILQNHIGSLPQSFVGLTVAEALSALHSSVTGVSSRLDAAIKNTIKSVSYGVSQTYASTVPTNLSWSTSLPSNWQPDDYLWTKIEFADGRVTYTVSRSFRPIKSVDQHYYLSTTESAVTGGTWYAGIPDYVDGMYYWSRISINYKDGFSEHGTPRLLKGFTNACRDALRAKVATQDSGWIEASTTSQFKTFNDRPYDIPKYRKIGKLVEIRGKVQPTAPLEGSQTDITIFNLPEGFRPPVAIHFVCQGSGKNTWLCSITAGGDVTFARYGVTGYIECPATAWLVIQANFYID